MIAAITDGGSSAGLMNYLAGPGRANEHSNPHLVAGSSVIMRRWGAWDELSPAQAYEIARWVDQFMVENKVRPVGDKRVFNQETGRRESLKDGKANHVWHCSLSLHPDEGPLGDEAWQAIANDFMDQMGFTGADGKAECRWVAINHGTAKNGGDHIHIMANIVRADGTKWSRWQDQPRVQRACNALEHRYGLRIIESREHARGARADSAADLRASERQGRRRTNRDVLEHRVRACAVASTSELDFLLRLREVGVKARPRFAPGRTDVVTGYWVGLHAPAGQRTQWYGGGRLARDLTLPRLRARWPDTPHSAQQAVDAWRQAWRGMPPQHISSRAEMAARVAALDAYAGALRGIDVRDPMALADASRDVAGLLGAQALAAGDGRAIELLSDAARAAGRAAQTHRRVGPAMGAAQAVSLAASLTLSAVINKDADVVVLAIQALALLEALAECYEAAQQVRTAQDMVERASAALEAVSNPTARAELASLRVEAAYEQMVGRPGPIQAAEPREQGGRGRDDVSLIDGEQHDRDPVLVAGREPAVVTAHAAHAERAQAPAGGVAGMSAAQVERIRAAAAMAMPAGSAPDTAASRSASAPADPISGRQASARGSDQQAGGPAGGTGSVSDQERMLERMRSIYELTLNAPASRSTAGPQAPQDSSQQPRSGHRSQSPTRRQGPRL